MAVTQDAQVMVVGGLVPTFVPADGTLHKFRNTGKEIVYVKNAHATVSRTVTIAPVTTVREGNAVFPTTAPSSLVNVVAALGEKAFGPIPSCYTDANGFCTFAFSSAADVSIAILQMSPV